MTSAKQIIIHTLLSLVVVTGFAVALSAGQVNAKLLPLAPDSWITERVKLSLLLDETVGASDLHVDTSHGHVTLHGSVTSEEAKQKAVAVAGSVEHVREVRDLMQVVPPRLRDAVAIGDQAIRRRVEWTLRDDPLLLDVPIEVVSVTDGVVVLGGRADTHADLLRAMRRVRQVEGVQRIASVVDLASIGRSGPPLSPVDDWPSKVPDSWITAAVKLRLLATPEVPALDISVDTDDRVVTLFGIVRSVEERKRAEEVALSVNPVRQVDNLLTIVPEPAKETSTVSDEQIRAGVKLAFAADPVLRDAQIDVVVVDGFVEIVGNAGSQFDRVQAVRTARAVAGVRAVVDKTRMPVAGESEVPAAPIQPAPAVDSPQ